MYDLTIIPISRKEGLDSSELLSFYVAEAPKRAERTRRRDRLVFYLCIKGTAPLPAEQQKQILVHLSAKYFKTPGSVTAALRKVALELNKILLERNYRLAERNRQTIALFTQIVIRDNHLYYAYSGPVISIWSDDRDMQRFEAPEMLGKGLGMGRSIPVNFSHFELSGESALLISAEPSSTWSPAMLRGLHKLSAEGIKKKIFGNQAPDLHALLLFIRPGQGKYFLMRPKVESKRQQQEDGIHPEKSSIRGEQVSQAVDELSESETDSATEPHVGIETAAISTTQSSAQSQSGFPEDMDVTPLPKIRRGTRSTSTNASFSGMITALISPIKSGVSRIVSALSSLLGRVLPEESLATVPSSFLITSAIAIPLIVVIAASLTYFQLGRSAQYELLISEARSSADQATKQTDLILQRHEWQTVLDLVNQAEVFRSNSETQHLKALAKGAIDQLDLVKRVNYQDAIIGGLPLSVNITRMVAANEELYMLDRNSGTVLRARKTTRGYELDANFKCNPGVGENIGAIVDIAPWPAGFEPQPQAALIALGASGSVVFCSPGQTPEIIPLTPSSTVVWSDIQNIAQDVSNVFVLDPSGIWVYWQANFSKSPVFAFAKGDRPQLDDIVDMAASGTELYLLHENGQVSICVLSLIEKAVPRCSSPDFVDNRPGRENTVMDLEHAFNRILLVPPPDPSIFLLDPENHAIFHFSMRSLIYQGQYLPLSQMSTQPATAIALDALTRVIFMATGNHVYYAILP